MAPRHALLALLVAAGGLLSACGGGSSPDTTTTTSTTTTVEEVAAGRCPVGTWRMDSPATGVPFNIESGGTGTVLTVDRDGSVVQDYDGFVPQWASSDSDPSMRTYFAPTGTILASVDLSSGSREWAVSNVDTSGLGGSGRSEVDGQVVMEFPNLQEIVAGMSGLEGATMTCAGDGTLTLSTGTIVHAYVAVT